MFKTIMLSAIVASSLFAAAVSAQAAVSAADCSYARSQVPNTSNRGSNFDHNQQLIQQCTEKGM